MGWLGRRAGFQGHAGNGDGILAAEGSGDFRGNLDVLLRGAACQEGGVQTAKDFLQGKINQHAVAVIFRGKGSRRRQLAQFAE